MRVIHGDNAEPDIRTFLNQALASVESLTSDGLITRAIAIITGAGSAWYDVVAECLANLTDYLAIIRPGCCAIHDTGIYLDAQSKVLQRAQVNQGYACELGGDLESALEVWAYVISRPEPYQASGWASAMWPLMRVYRLPSAAIATAKLYHERLNLYCRDDQYTFVEPTVLLKLKWAT